jgi:hypothetical protein
MPLPIKTTRLAATRDAVFMTMPSFGSRMEETHRENQSGSGKVINTTSKHVLVMKLAKP